MELLVSMGVKHNNVLLNLITGCLYWFSKTLLCLTAILTNSNHQHNCMEGTKKTVMEVIFISNAKNSVFL